MKKILAFVGYCIIAVFAAILTIRGFWNAAVLAAALAFVPVIIATNENDTDTNDQMNE